MEHLTFAASSGLALILTNLDNMAVLFALLVPLGAKRAIAGFVGAQVIVLSAALMVAFGASDVLASYSGYLGVVPIAMGSYGLFQAYVSRSSPSDATAPGVVNSAPAALTLFLAMSMDSFAILMPLLTDSLPMFRAAGVVGAGCAIALMAISATLLAGIAGRAGQWMQRAEILGPCVMIVSGFYVLLDSGTDML